MNKPEILIIDDEAQIRKLLSITLVTNDYKTREAVSAKEGLMLAKNINPDLVLLDLGLPDDSGHNVLTKLREWYTRPVIILSVQNNEEDIVKALDNGANDYLVKPFRTGELLARIRTSLKKRDQEATQANRSPGDLEIDPDLRIVKKKKNLLKLTSTEYDLLVLLMRNEGRVLTHQYLLREVWGPGYIDQSQYLRVFIGQLRKKIEAELNHPEYILTESGVGYRFINKESSN